MTTVEKQLWDKLERFRFDSEGTQLTFAKRLARENGWHDYYTHRVIGEYKKFIFLCCVSPTPVTPSDPVDQAWHLHLTYTKSYWDGLCESTLGRKIHHNPTRGGSSERHKFDGCYTTVRELYLSKFGTPPPPDIWQGNNERFSETSFRRVSLNRYFLLPKPSKVLRDKALQTLLVAGALLCLQASPGAFIVIALLVGFVIAAIRGNNRNDRGKGGNNSGGSVESAGFTGFIGDSDSSSGGDTGCSSQSDSGADSGCSGCGGGCGGD